MDFNRGGHHMPRGVPPYCNGPNGFKFPPPPPFMINDNLSNYTNFNHYGGMAEQPMNMTDASSLPPIGVFWDIENCNIPRGKSALAAAQAIRHRFFRKYREAEFVVVCDVTKESEQVVKELEDAQVDLKHVSAKSKNACDEKLRQAMRRFSDTHSSPAAMILISSDVNFVTDLSDFKNRKKIHIILIHNERCADALIMAANEHYNFKQLLEPIAKREHLKDPTTEIIVTNLPANYDLSKVHARLKILSENTGGKIRELRETFALLSFATFESASRACKRMDGEEVFGHKIIAAIRHSTEGPKVGPPKSPYLANENCYNQEMFYQPYNQAYGYQGNEAPPNVFGLSSGFKNYEKSAGKNNFGIEEISEQTSAFEKNVRGKGKKDQIDTRQNLKTDLTKDKDINEKTAEKLKKDEKICCLHDKRNIKEGFPPLPSVMVTLEKFTRDVMNLLDSHNNHVPLISFYECYISLCGPLDTNEKGIPLEHLITCLDHVNIVVSNGNKVVKTMLKHVIPKDEKFLKSSSTSLPNSLVHLSSELMNLIRLQPSGQLSLHQLLGRYQSLFKKEIKLSDYGYSSMAKLLDAMSDLFQVLGVNDQKIIMISHKEQLKSFYRALILVLDRQPSRVLYETSIPAELEKLGQPFKPVDYGLCYFQDLLISISDALHIYMSGSDRIICKKDNDGNHFSQSEADSSKALLTPNMISLPLEEISEQSTKFEELRGSAKKKEKQQKPKVEIQKLKEAENSSGLLSAFKKLFVDESGASNPENVGTLSKSSSTASIPSDETFCSKHSNESSLNNNQIFRILIDLKTFSINVHVLLTSHEKGIPLKSFVDCYGDMFGSLKSNETGVALEHLLTCVDYVKLVQKNGVKYIVKTSEKIKHIDTENFITGIEMNKLSHFGHEAIVLLQNQMKMEIPFDQFVCAYHQHFDKQLKLADFGVSKFATLISHLQNYIQVMGEGKDKVLTITHVFNVRNFFIELSELLEAQSTKSLLSSKFLQEYNKTYGKLFDARNFGLCYLDDLLGCLTGLVTILPLKKDKMICFNGDATVGDMVPVSPLVIEQKLNILSNQILNLVYPYYPNGLRLDTLLLMHQLKYGSMLKMEFQQCSNLEGFVNSLPSVKVTEFSRNKVVVPKNNILFEKVFKLINALILAPGGKLNQKDFNDLLIRYKITLQSVNDFISMVPDVIDVINSGKETVYSLTFSYQFVRAVYEISFKFGDAAVQALPLPTLEEKYFQLYKKKIEPSKYGFRTLRQLLSAFPRHFSANERTLFYYAIENERKQVYVSSTSEDSKDGAQNKNGQKGKANKTPNKSTPQGGTSSVPKPPAKLEPTQPGNSQQKNQNVQSKKPAVKASKVTKQSPGHVKASKVTKQSPGHVKAGENVAKPHKPKVKPHVKKPTQNSS